MWIRKSDWEFEKGYRKTQNELIENQESLIKNLEEQIETLKELAQLSDRHYEEMYALCKEVVAQNDKLLEQIKELETKEEN